VALLRRQWLQRQALETGCLKQFLDGGGVDRKRRPAGKVIDWEEQGDELPAGQRTE
jgi:hypothetical protein